MPSKGPLCQPVPGRGWHWGSLCLGEGGVGATCAGTRVALCHGCATASEASQGILWQALRRALFVVGARARGHEASRSEQPGTIARASHWPAIELLGPEFFPVLLHRHYTERRICTFWQLGSLTRLHRNYTRAC